MSKPILTVLMAVRNGEPYLREAISSILKQTYRDFCFLILDDASTDSSREIIREFKDPRIELIVLPRNIGQTAALNYGLQMIDTAFVARMDADDVSLPQRLERQLTYLTRHPNTVLLGTNYCCIDSNGVILRENSIPVRNNCIAWSLFLVNHLAHSSIMMQTKKIQSMGGYDENFNWAQDYELYGRLMRAGEQFASFPETLVYIRWHPQAMTSSINNETKSEPAKTRCANIRHFLPNMTVDTLQRTIAILRVERKPVTESEAQETIAIQTALFKAFCERSCPTPEEITYIRRDIAKRLVRLATVWLKVFPRAAVQAYRYSLSWDPLGNIFLFTLLRDILIQKGLFRDNQ